MSKEAIDCKSICGCFTLRYDLLSLVFISFIAFKVTRLTRGRLVQFVLAMIVRSVIPVSESGDRIMTSVTIVRIEGVLGIIAMRALQNLSLWLPWLFYYGVVDKWCSRLRFCLLHFLLFLKQLIINQVVVLRISVLLWGVHNYSIEFLVCVLGARFVGQMQLGL